MSERSLSEMTADYLKDRSLEETRRALKASFALTKNGVHVFLRHGEITIGADKPSARSHE